LDQYWRDNLVRLLETALAVLKAPLVEPRLIKKAGKMLHKLAAKVGEDASTAFIGGLAGAAASSLLSIF
jgi:hypothetical protein